MPIQSASLPITSLPGESERLSVALHVPIIISMSHPDFAVFTVSWELALLRADGSANGTVKAYQNAVRSLDGWRRRWTSRPRSSWATAI